MSQPGCGVRLRPALAAALLADRLCRSIGDGVLPGPGILVLACKQHASQTRKHALLELLGDGSQALAQISLCSGFGTFQ